MVDADLPVVPIRLDPGRMPITLPRIADGIHHEGVDVGDGDLVLRQGVAHGLLLFIEQAGWPGVGHVGHDLDAGVADRGQTAHRLGEGEAQVGVGAKGQFLLQGTLPLRMQCRKRPKDRARTPPA